MAHRFFSTREVALSILRLKPDSLLRAIWQNRIDPPEKGPGGNYLWTVEDAERISWALHCRRAFEDWMKENNETILNKT